MRMEISFPNLSHGRKHLYQTQPRSIVYSSRAPICGGFETDTQKFPPMRASRYFTESRGE